MCPAGRPRVQTEVDTMLSFQDTPAVLLVLTELTFCKMALLFSLSRKAFFMC